MFPAALFRHDIFLAPGTHEDAVSLLEKSDELKSNDMKEKKCCISDSFLKLSFPIKA